MTDAQTDNTLSSSIVTAAVLLIGDEILSGRTVDQNLTYMATWLGEHGIHVKEARVVADDEEAIIDAVNTLRQRYSYVFTTGGIGPTHDDITAEAIAKAFEVPITIDPEARAILQSRYADQDLNESRLRMARIPDGATLIENPISKAPGFQLDNVFVMAGIPLIMQAMLESVRDRLVGGPVMQSKTVAAALAEGDLAAPLGALQDRFPHVAIGSYPYYRQNAFGAMLVLRSTDEDALQSAYEELCILIKDLGAEPILGV